MRSLQEIRAIFPALAGETIYLENAGGSQIPSWVADAIHGYMTSAYVQLGAGYGVSEASTKTVADARRFANRYVNGEGIGMTILGPSTSQLCAMLAACYAKKLEPGDEVIICETAHEANAGPWARLNRYGITVRTWKVDREGRASLDELQALLSDRTKIVAFPHVSNLLGEIVDVQAITSLVQSVGAKVVVDGVAYAPHRAIDVAAWGVDFYVYSAYKVFGPHMAAMFGRSEAWAELEAPNHFFLPRDEYAFELGGPSHEACAGLLALQPYLAYAVGSPESAEMRREGIESAWGHFAALELPLQERLVGYLRGHPRVQIVGPQSAGLERVPTVSFVHESLRPSEITAITDRANIGIRYGHMYAYRLCEAMGIDTNEGVVRVSAVHYNTLAEIETLIDVLDRVL